MDLQERSRIDMIVLRTKPSIMGLVDDQPDILFFQQFRNLQIPCQDCGMVQATVRCHQCMMSFCQGCFDNNHKVSCTAVSKEMSRAAGLFQDLATATKAARSATSVLPKPTSPQTSRSITRSLCMSSSTAAPITIWPSRVRR